MRKSDTVFTREERRTAMWALLMAAMIAVGGIYIQHWSQPSLGPYGAEAYAYAPAAGVLDARPVADGA